MKKRTCIICGGRKYRLFSQIEKAKLYCCVKCDLGVYEYPKGAKSTSTVLPLAKRTRELLTVIKTQIRWGKMIEVGLDRKGQEYVKVIRLTRRGESTRVINKSYSDFIKTTKERFDLIAFIHILDTYRRPDILIHRSKAALLDRGLIVVVVPNRAGFYDRINLGRSIYSFSNRAMRALFEKNNLQIKYKLTHDSARSYLEGRPKEASLYLFKLPLYLVFRRALWMIGMGGHLVVVSEKI